MFLLSDDKLEYESCTMKDLDYSVLATQTFEEVVASMPSSKENEAHRVVQCTSRDFEPNHDSIVTKVSPKIYFNFSLNVVSYQLMNIYIPIL